MFHQVSHQFIHLFIYPLLIEYLLSKPIFCEFYNRQAYLVDLEEFLQLLLYFQLNLFPALCFA